MDFRDLTDLSLEYDDDPDGFRAGYAKLGPDLGARTTGTTLYEIPPGQALCPYHYEFGEEEWVLVLQGTATIRTPSGLHELRPQQLTFFPPGPDGAHQVRNAGEETLRVLMWSSIVHPGATVYPDSDKIGIWVEKGSDENGTFPRSAKVDYYAGEAG